MSDVVKANVTDELKWRSFALFSTAELGTIELKSEAVQKVWNNYEAHLDRIKGTIAIPALSSEFRMIYRQSIDIAIFKLTGKLDFTDDWREREGEIVELARRLMNEYFVALNSLKTGDVEKDKQVELGISIGIIQRDATIMPLLQNNDKVKTGLEHTIEICLSSAWTAFETMAGDLWEEAINIHPLGLASLSGKSRYVNKSKPNRRSTLDAAGDEMDKLQRKGDRKSIPINLIGQEGYDVKNRMGSILRSKYTFSGLANIRKAYEDAFTGDTQEIDKLVQADILDELSAIRNVIVHRAGICDWDYEDNQKAIPNLPRANRGEKIRFDGTYAYKILLVTSVISNQLIGAVDKWIVDN